MTKIDTRRAEFRGIREFNANPEEEEDREFSELTESAKKRRTGFRSVFGLAAADAKKDGETPLPLAESQAGNKGDSGLREIEIYEDWKGVPGMRGFALKA